MNAPKVIYLQVGDDIGCDEQDWSEATWCEDSVFSNDVEYRQAQPLLQDIRDYKNDIDQLRKQLEGAEHLIIELEEKARRIYTPSGFYLMNTEREVIEMRQQMAKQLEMKK